MIPRPLFQTRRTLAALAACCAWWQVASASEFSVTPVRVELKAGVLSETITVVNHAEERLRVSVKLMEWSQDAEGADVYKESSDLIYFPRQLELDPNSRKLVRVGAKVPAGASERTYRLFIEEQPMPLDAQGKAQVAFYFRFGVPIFLTPAVPKPVPEVGEPRLDKGRLRLSVKNAGNQHFRLTKVNISDGATYSQDIQGWYSLAGTERSYSAEIPKEVCQKATTLQVGLEGEGFRVERKLNVDRSSCS